VSASQAAGILFTDVDTPPVPIAAVLIFATQGVCPRVFPNLTRANPSHMQDLVRVWIPWKRRPDAVVSGAGVSTNIKSGDVFDLD